MQGANGSVIIYENFGFSNPATDSWLIPYEVSTSGAGGIGKPSDWSFDYVRGEYTNTSTGETMLSSQFNEVICIYETTSWGYVVDGKAYETGTTTELVGFEMGGWWIN